MAKTKLIEIIDRIIYCLFGTSKHEVDYKEELSKMSMSEAESFINNCHYYYQILI